MNDHMPRKDAELPPRMPEAATIAELRAELSQVKADSAAALALVVERALAPVADLYEKTCASHTSTLLRRQVVTQLIALEGEIRALAHVDGMAEVQALRAERNALQERVRMLSFMGEGYMFLERERDTIAADVARLKDQVAGLVEAGDKLEASCIKAIGQRIHPAWIAIRTWRRAALAQAQPAAEEGKL